MKKLLIATTNQGKIEMFNKILSKLDNIEILYLSDFPVVEEPEENGATVQANALIKAKYYAEQFNIATLADDAGFSIDKLGGEPGVKARRWAWELADNVSDEDCLDFYLEKVKLINQDILDASHPFCRCIYVDGKAYYQNWKIDVKLTKTPRRPYVSGFPVSSMAIIDGRHRLDIPEEDPIWESFYQEEGLYKIVREWFNII